MTRDIEPIEESQFEIRQSQEKGGASLVSPDLATCSECVQELYDDEDHRFGYAFTNCTNCGPRYSIIRGMPYDRKQTTMDPFVMCSSCSTEYDDPNDRRFHAQPNACPKCGPHLWYTPVPGSRTDLNAVAQGQLGDTASTEDPIQVASSLLRLGGTVAIKGLGGFHLACDATNEQAVRWLRRRKGRDSKPFAVMMADIETIRQYCWVSEQEYDLLTSTANPIVLLDQRPGTDLAFAISPRNHTVGVMLPYTPMHHLLMQDVDRPLVMTSGNHSDEPIASDNRSALEQLGDIADGFLMHNREIETRNDDSVWMSAPIAAEERHNLPIRRSRGIAPLPITLPVASDQTVLAVGAQMKSVFCLAKHDNAYLSHHIGEMENLETLDFFIKSIGHLSKLFRLNPSHIAHDIHPGYLSTRYAQESGLIALPVQHHHAHIASCLADNNISEKVIGVALDGTGYGDDGTIWGGEILVADLLSYQRAAYLEPLPLPGGEASIHRPYRTALAYLHNTMDAVPDLALLKEMSTEEQSIVLRQAEGLVHTPLTSSCGRLFDAVASIMNVRQTVTYEAQAAIEFEMIAGVHSRSDRRDSLQWLDDPYPVVIDDNNGHLVVNLAPLLQAVASDAMDSVALPTVSRRFHATIARVVLDICERLKTSEELNLVALSGGCFQNRLLLHLTHHALVESGFDVLLHRQVPPNDGGIALGQAAVATASISSS